MTGTRAAARRAGVRSEEAGEQGSVLIAVLCFLTLFSVLIAAGALLANSHLKAGQVSRTERDNTLDAEGVAQVAIQNIRADATKGRVGETCPTVTYATFTAACAGQTGSGTASGGSSGGIPAVSALASGTAVVFGSSNQIIIDGDVKANGMVSSNGPGVTINGTLTSSDYCWGNFTATTQKCPTSPAPAVDPNWSPATTTKPANKSVPACPSKRVVKFEPGTYTDINALNLLSDGVACPGAILWFQPGTYYFPFTSNWNLGGSSVKVVGGAAKGWDTNGNKPSVPFPGGCDDTKPGVQFIFGGGSAPVVSVNQASVELCGPNDTNDAAIYTLKSSVGGMTAWTNGSCTWCDLVQVGGSGSKFSVRGSVYTPNARFNISLSSTAAPIATRGIIAQVVYLTVGTGTNPVAAGGTGTVVYSDRDVVFTVKRGALTVLVARVGFADGGGATPGSSVAISRWTLNG